MPPPDSVGERCERIAAALGTVRHDGEQIGKWKYLQELHLLMLREQELAGLAPVWGVFPPVLHETAGMPVHLRKRTRLRCMSNMERTRRQYL